MSNYDIIRLIVGLAMFILLAYAAIKIGQSGDEDIKREKQLHK